jgi:ectoine hydroxylase-related dioxygenase (phytanoyl-CoA dioxygenase family)
MVVPGSAKEGNREHEWQGVHAVIPDTGFDVSAAEPLDAKAGDTLLFSSLLVHQTVGNRTTYRNRRAWVIQYCRGDQHNEVTGEVYDDRAWAVRGGEIVEELRSERPFVMR